MASPKFGDGGGSRTDGEGRAPLLLFIFALLFFAFGYGFVSAFARIPPHETLSGAYEAAADLARHWKNDLNIEPTRHLVPASPGRSAFLVRDGDAIADGHRFISQLTPSRSALYGAVLYSHDGEEIHYWPIDYGRIDPEGPDPENVFPHGVEVFEDGSIVVNFDDGSGIARIDACGDVLWKLKGYFHHAIYRSGDGTLWTLRGQRMVQLDADTGEELDRIDLRKHVIDAHRLQGVFAIKTKEGETELNYVEDPFHTNDVEVLEPHMADAFPMFRAGDLLISLRSINLVAVIDRENHGLKWWSVGPWHRQHDPDFLPDGSISVYNNNMGLGSSQILTIDPESRDVRILFEGSKSVPFYSWRRGKHQHLPNGNILVAETERGRALELDRSGAIVWEYNNIYDEHRNGVVGKATLLATDYFDSGALDCDGRVEAVEP